MSRPLTRSTAWARAGGVAALPCANALDPQADFLLFGGDLAQLG